jgi:Mn2+/Fe2+ NRAMP family transporter
MGGYANPRWLKILAWSVAWAIAALNAYLVVQMLRGAV